MFSDSESFLAAGLPYLAEANARFIEANGLEKSAFIDHICYKCSSTSEFEHLRRLLERDPPSAHLHQVFLSDRRVAYFGLRRAITVDGTRPVRYVELADAKPREDQLAGFHHVEIVPLGISYSSLLERVEARGVKAVLKVRPHHTTHDIDLQSGLIVRLTPQPLIRTIAEHELLA